MPFRIPPALTFPKQSFGVLLREAPLCEAIQLRLLFWMFLVAFLMESDPVISGLPCLPVIKAETFPQPGDLLLASSGACDKMTQPLGADLCLPVADEKYPKWPLSLPLAHLPGAWPALWAPPGCMLTADRCSIQVQASQSLYL